MFHYIRERKIVHIQLPSLRQGPNMRVGFKETNKRLAYGNKEEHDQTLSLVN